MVKFILRKHPLRVLFVAILAVISSIGGAKASLISQTLTGTFTTDDEIRLFSLVLSQPSDVVIFTNSYGGGVNLNGTNTPAGGFEPILSLFSPTGSFIAEDGGDLFPFGDIDPATGVAGDARLMLAGLSAGTYTLALTEFFNFPNGDLADGFFEAGAGNFTGPTCSQPGASFLQTDLVACPQRTNAFTVNIDAAAVPEPPTIVLLSGALLAFGLVGSVARRQRC